MGKAKGVGKRGVGSSKSRKTHKQGLRAQFESRHLDQIWEDVRKAVTVHDGKTAPVGTTDRYATAPSSTCVGRRSLVLTLLIAFAGPPLTKTCLHLDSTTASLAGLYVFKLLSS